jgi:hypothetical protein
MPPCVRIECGVCYSRLSKWKDWNQKRVVWDAFWWYAIALVQDGGPKLGSHGSIVDIPKARGATDEKLRFKLPMGCFSSFRTVSRSMARRS